jgi:adenine-specific DNA-methyltransferase
MIKSTAVANSVRNRNGEAAYAVKPSDVVHTRPWTVELILNLAGYKADSNLVDAVAIEPAAGDGAFLIEMAERLIASCRNQGRPITDCADSLRAYELDSLSAGRARVKVIAKLNEMGVSNIEAKYLGRKWVRQGDYILERGRRQDGKAHLASPQKESLLGNVDFVIGNPPYIRLEEIPADKNIAYRGMFPTMKGRADIYIAFFEAALRQLKPEGVCAFICSDRWMLNQYGSELRGLITSGYSIETIIEMHGVDAFESDVIAYPAITVIRRKPQRHAVVARASSMIVTNNAAFTAKSVHDLYQKANGNKLPLGLRAYRAETWFRGHDPWPCTSPERLSLLKLLEREFLPLESEGTNTKVGIGVATGLDHIYITRDPELVEHDRLLPLALTSDIVTGKLKGVGHYLVNPWTKSGLVDLSKFPRLKAYYEGARKQIEKRNVARRDPQRWYRTIDRVNFELTGRRKLYIPDIKNVIHPVLDYGQTYPHHNLYFITSDDWDLEVLGALLLSDVGRFFVECYGVRMRGGYLRMQAQYLRRIRAPHPRDISSGQSQSLKRAFRARDVKLATRIALEVYDIRHIPAEEEGSRY